jgi:hypothetical protein
MVEYFSGERSEMFAMLAGAILFSAGALWLFLAARTSFALAFMATVFLFASLMSAGTVSLLIRDAKTPVVLSRAFSSAQQASSIADEEERIRVVISKYKYYRYGAAVIGLIAITGLLTLNKGSVHGVAAGLLLLVPAQTIIDHFSERRAHTYLEQLNHSSASGRSNS